LKKHITKDDVSQLTQEQKQHLRQLWLPEKYDLSLAYVCKNAETEELDEIEFVVGKITLINTRVILSDLRSINDNESDESEPESSLSDSNVKNFQEDNFGEDETTLEAYDDSFEENDEEDYDFESLYQRPTTFVKEDCLPLLSIGQMIEILTRSNYKSIDFYLLADSGEIGCELGNKAFNLSGYESDFDSKEFCDVLWDCVKKVL